jgi:hypothetical protein
VLERSDAVRHLVEHGWVLLHAIDPSDGRVLARSADGSWQPVTAGEAASELEGDTAPIGALQRGARGPDVVHVAG